MDFVYKPNKHSVTAELRKDYADHIITLYAASKTFNLAGMKVSQLITSNLEILQKIKDVYMSLGLHGVNTLGLIASTAAYTYGDDYVDHLVDYLDTSIKWLQHYLETELPQVKLINPQGTYILWLDFKALKMSQDDLDFFCLNEAKIWLNNGTLFGRSGEGFMRINLALPLSELKFVMEQLKKAIINK
jgi:cystathionine beta-lyase